MVRLRESGDQTERSPTNGFGFPCRNRIHRQLVSLDSPMASKSIEEATFILAVQAGCGLFRQTENTWARSWFREANRISPLVMLTERRYTSCLVVAWRESA
jgi:hypothetical protein